jgi:hypothetical protein
MQKAHFKIHKNYRNTHPMQPQIHPTKITHCKTHFENKQNSPTQTNRTVNVRQTGRESRREARDKEDEQFRLEAALSSFQIEVRQMNGSV